MQKDYIPMYQEVMSNNFGLVKILGRKGKSCIIQFENTGYTVTANIDNVKAGKIRDPYAKTVYGVGYLGEFKKTSYSKQAKQLWQNMMKRCYSTKDPRGYRNKGVTVDDRWKCFANFLEDLPELHNFDKWLEGQIEGKEKYNLDKDLRIQGNKVYSFAACGFETEFNNKSAGGINRHKNVDKD